MGEARHTDTSPASAALALWIDRRVDRFEAALLAVHGALRPRIEEYLAGSSGTQRQLLLRELLSVELEVRRRRGELPVADEYLSRFPADAAVVADVFGEDNLGTSPEADSVSLQVCTIASAEPPTSTRLGAHDTAEATRHRELRGGAMGSYRVVREVGRGGMGTVYQAYDPQLDRFVAIKVLSHVLCGDRDAVQQFLVEARAAAAIDHPNVATVFEIGQLVDGNFFIAMGYYEGQTLKDRLAGGPLGVTETWEIATQIARGLEAAHRRGIVHRDIKPSNLLLTREGVVKLVDFGLARMDRWQHAKEGNPLGTLAYMSPEQLRGKVVDARTDLWSLGVVVYELLTARHPFRTENAEADD
jgi:hypothetical protein